MAERPKLAPGVDLAGQMQESAVVNPPWLLEREEAGYIQVTELLYRVAERYSVCLPPLARVPPRLDVGDGRDQLIGGDPGASPWRRRLGGRWGIASRFVESMFLAQHGVLA
jgi:hypothetical protein